MDVLDTQGWPHGYLCEALLELARTGSPRLQKYLAHRVEALVRQRGFGYVIDAWGGDIERVKAFHVE